jgi:thiosulfate reductase cytochrome b subunit
MRWLHLVVGLALGTYDYLPTYVPGQPLLHLVLMVAGVPLVTLSGIVLWKQAALRRLVARVRPRR